MKSRESIAAESLRSRKSFTLPSSGSITPTQSAIFDNLTDIEIEPFPTPFVAFPNFLAKKEESVILQNNLWSIGQSFYIKILPELKRYIRVEDKSWSLRDTKNCYDADGKLIFKIKEKLATLKPELLVQTPEGKTVFSCKKNISIMNTKVTSQYFLHDEAENKKIEGKILIQGDYYHDRDIVLIDERNDLPIAIIDRNVFGWESLIGLSKYRVVVAQNVDVALVSAICICLDMMYKGDTGT